MDQHYCQVHKTKFYQNQKVDVDGTVKTWYSHKKADGSGFCTEQIQDSQPQKAVQLRLRDDVMSPSYQKMYACNAMNNAVALACNGKIQVDQIEAQYRRILTELKKVN